jgi:hypothetical protein
LPRPFPSQEETASEEYLFRVVFEDNGDCFLVITGYLTSQISRYWKE